MPSHTHTHTHTRTRTHTTHTHNAFFSPPYVKGFINTLFLVSEKNLHHSGPSWYASRRVCVCVCECVCVCVCVCVSLIAAHLLLSPGESHTHSCLQVIFKKSVLTGSFLGVEGIFCHRLFLGESGAPTEFRPFASCLLITLDSC